VGDGGCELFLVLGDASEGFNHRIMCYVVKEFIYY
jgi:hypothetical protein